MSNPSKKLNHKSSDLKASSTESNIQNKVKSEISVLDEFILEIFIDFLNNEKTQHNIFEFNSRLLKFLAIRFGSKVKNALRAKKSKSDKDAKRKIKNAQILPEDEVRIDNKKKVDISIAPQIEGSSPSSVVEPSNRPTKLFTPGGKSTIFNEDNNFIIDTKKLDNLTMIDKSEEVVVSLVIEQLKNMQDKLKAKEVVFKTIDDVLDFTKGKLKNLQISNENINIKSENKSQKVEIKTEKVIKLERIEKIEVKSEKIEKLEIKPAKIEKLEIKPAKIEKLEIKPEKIENLEDKMTKIVNQNVMNDNFSKSANKNNILKDEVPSPSPKLVHVKVSFNASDLKSLTSTLFENVGKWQNQIKNQRPSDKKISKITRDDQTICL